MQKALITVVFLLIADSIFIGCDSKRIIMHTSNLSAGFKVAVLGVVVGGDPAPSLSKRFRTVVYGDSCLSYGEMDPDKRPRKFQDAFSVVQKDGFSSEALSGIFNATGADALIFMRIYNFTEKGAALETRHEKLGRSFQAGGPGKSVEKSTQALSKETFPFEKNGIELMLFEKDMDDPVVLYKTHADRKSFETVLESAMREFRDIVARQSVCAGAANLI